MSGYRSVALFSENPRTIDIYAGFARNGNHDLLHLAKNPQNIRELATKKFDLVIIEITNPSMTEIEFVDMVHSTVEATPLIVVSSYFYETREIVFGNKISAFIQNPLTVEKLERETEGFFKEATAEVTAAQPENHVERLIQLNKRLTVLLELTRSLTSITDLDELLAHIVKMTPEVLSAERATVFIHDRAKKELWSRTGTGLKAADIRFPDTQGIAGEIFTSGLPSIISDPYNHPKFNKEFDLRSGFRTLNILCYPLKNINGETIGVIQVLNKKGGEFDQDDESYLGALASGIGIVIENALLREKIKKQLEEVQQAYYELDIAQNTILKETKTATIFELQGIIKAALGEANPLELIKGMKNDYLYDSRLLRQLETIEEAIKKVFKDTDEFVKQNVQWD